MEGGREGGREGDQKGSMGTFFSPGVGALKVIAYTIVPS